MMSPRPESRLERIRITGGNGPRDSLLACLQAVLRALDRGGEPGPRVAGGGGDITQPAAMGASSALSNGHAFLGEIARRFGLEIRELHPPSAAPASPTPREFDWHFRDSYLPFIRAALARDEPVLAWRGWPAPHEAEWGIITEVDEATGQCSGWTLGGRKQLESTPVQVYLISPARG